MGEILTTEAIFLRLPKSLFDRLNKQVSRMATSRTMLVRMAIVKYIEELEKSDQITFEKPNENEI